MQFNVIAVNPLQLSSDSAVSSSQGFSIPVLLRVSLSLSQLLFLVLSLACYVLKLSTPGVSRCDSLHPVVPACICQMTPGRIQDEPAWLLAPRSVPSSSAPCSTTSQLHPVWLPAAVSLETPFGSGTGNVHWAHGSCLRLDFLSAYVMLAI